MADDSHEAHNVTDNKLKNTPSDNSEMGDRFSFDTNRDLSSVDQRIISHVTLDRERHLPADFEPDDWTVICSRGLMSFHHEGNVRFRALIDERLDSYTEASTKMARSAIVSQIVETIRSKARSNAGFVRQDAESSRWFEVGDRIAREKVGQAIRSALKKQDRHEPKKRSPNSSNKQEKAKRKREISSSCPSSANSSPSISSSKYSSDLHDSKTGEWLLDQGPAIPFNRATPLLGKRSLSCPPAPEAYMTPSRHPAIEQSHSAGGIFGESAHSLPHLSDRSYNTFDWSQSAFRAEGGMRHSEESFMCHSEPRPTSFHRPSLADGLDGLRPSLSYDQISSPNQPQPLRSGFRSTFDLDTSLDESSRGFRTRHLEPLPLSAPSMGESVLSVENLRMIESINESKMGEPETSSSWREYASSMLDHQISPPGRSHAPVYPRPDYPVQSIQPVPWRPPRQRSTSEHSSSNSRSMYTEDDSQPISRILRTGGQATDHRG